MTKEEQYDLELDRVVAHIRGGGHRRVGFQLPDGLKHLIPLIADRIDSETRATPIFCTEPCFGACDISETLPKLGCDLIVHMGHSKMVEDDEVEVLYIPCFSKIPAEEVLRQNLGGLAQKKIGLVASVQHVKELPRLAKILSDNGFKVHIGEPGRRTEFPGQVLGCNYDAARKVAGDVDAFLYVGGGNFHPLGVSLATGKDVLVLDPYRGELREIRELVDRTLRKRFAQIENARGSRSIGLLVSTKPGQRRIDEAASCLGELRERGIRSDIISYDRLEPARLSLYSFDAYVNFGCPRMAVDDSELFPGPILTPRELDILLGKSPWEEYAPDEIA